MLGPIVSIALLYFAEVTQLERKSMDRYNDECWLVIVKIRLRTVNFGTQLDLKISAALHRRQSRNDIDFDDNENSSVSSSRSQNSWLHLTIKSEINQKDG